MALIIPSLVWDSGWLKCTIAISPFFAVKNASSTFLAVYVAPASPKIENPTTSCFKLFAIFTAISS